MSNDVWKPAELRNNLSLEDLIRWGLQFAILAPSAHNTQPWCWEVGEGFLLVKRDPEHTLDSDPTLRETFIGIAAFIENFIIAVSSKGYDAEVEILAKNNFELKIAKISLSKASESSGGGDSLKLIEAIVKRHTNRGQYMETPLPEGFINDIKKINSPAKLFTIVDATAKERIARLVQRGYAIALSMPDMERELASLISSEKDRVGTGMTIESMYPSTNNLRADNWIDQRPDPIEESEKIGERFKSSQALFVIGTDTDGPNAWIDAGRLLERILLIAAAHDLTHDISAAPIEIPTLSPLLRKEIEEEYRPQALVRIGEPVDKAFTKLSTRRPITT